MKTFSIRTRNGLSRLAVLCIFGLAAAPTPHAFTFDWAKSFGGRSLDAINSLDIGPDGAIVAAGRFEEAVDIGGMTFTSLRSHTNGFVVKLEPDGDLLWARHLSGTGTVFPNDIAVDGSGNIWVTGYFLETMNVGKRQLISAGGADGFVVKFGPSGDVLASWNFGGDGLHPDNGAAIAVDAAGNAYVGGNFRGAMRAGGVDYGAPSLDIDRSILFKLASDGAVQWGREADGLRILDLDVDAEGNAATTGWFVDEAGYGTRRVVGAGTSDVFVSRHLTNGTLDWLKSTGGPGMDEGKSIAVGPGGIITVAGHYVGSSHIFGKDLTESTREDWFAARLDASGAPIWVTEGGGSEEVTPTRVAVDPDGNTLLAGGFYQLFRAGPEWLAAPYGRIQGFLVRLNDIGEIRSAVKVGEPGMARFEALQALPEGGWVAGGFFEGDELTLGRSVLRSVEWVDAFIVSGGRRSPAPGSDAGEEGERPLDPWTHEHWQCPETRGEWDRDRTCPGVFRNGAAPRSSQDVWTIETHDLTLHDRTDVDRFRFTLPVITDPAWGDDHADIRPRVAPHRGPDPEPLLECGSVRREELGPDGRENTIRVALSGKLRVKVVPTPNALTATPVSLRGESLRLFQDGVARDAVVSGSSTDWEVACPDSRYGFTTLDLTFGERSGSRFGSDLGGYSLIIEFRIDAERGIPDWVFSWPDERNARMVAPLLCPMRFGRRGNFPGCFDFPARFDVFHPRFPTPDCIVDGPGCMDLSSFFWDSQSSFSLRMQLPKGLEVSVLDAARKPLASAKSAAMQNAKGLVPWVGLSAPLKPGWHFLAVKGPPGIISAALTRAEDEQAMSPPSSGAGRYRWPVLLGVALLSALLVYIVMARKLRSRTR